MLPLAQAADLGTKPAEATTVRGSSRHQEAMTGGEGRAGPPKGRKAEGPSKGSHLPASSPASLPPPASPPASKRVAPACPPPAPPAPRLRLPPPAPACLREDESGSRRDPAASSTRLDVPTRHRRWGPPVGPASGVAPGPLPSASRRRLQPHRVAGRLLAGHTPQVASGCPGCPQVASGCPQVVGGAGEGVEAHPDAAGDAPRPPTRAPR